MIDAIKIIKKLDDNGFQAVLAGGCVRDLILGLPSNDYDIATNATPEVIESLFEKTIPVGKSFGVIIVIENDKQYEIATFREDGKYSDNRRPDSVTFGSIEEDAKRRDLTINGIFYDPIINKYYDFVNGVDDIQRKIVRFIGDPNKRIEEDKLRILRACRFSIKFDFEIEKESFEAIKNHAHEIQTVSIERISDEFIKILRLRKPKKAFDLLFETKLIDYVLPEIRTLQGVEQPIDYHPEGCVLTHTIKTLENLPENASDELLMGMLLHDIGKPATFEMLDRIRFNGHDKKGAEIAEVILKRMKFSNDFIDRVVSLVSDHMKFMAAPIMKMSTLKRFVRQPHFNEHLVLHRADCLSSHGNLDNYNFVVQKMNEIPPEKIKPPKLITGKDLLDLGFIEGPIFRTILDDIDDKQLEEIIKDRESALLYVKQQYTK
jgi:poly(A) polymerase